MGILAVVAIVVAFVFFRSLSRPGESTARFIPSNALAYASINLRPGVQQLSHARDVISTLQTDALVERRDALLDELEDETGIHFLDDVETWLGESVSVALVSADGGSAEWVAMVHVSDRGAALDFTEDLVAYFEDEFLTRFDRTAYRDADLWLSDDEDLGFALTDEYLLLADGEDTLERVIRDADSPPEASLLEDEEFKSARDSLPSQRVAFMFLRGDWILDLLGDVMYPFGGQDDVIREIEDGTPKYMAVSVSFIEQGLRADFAAEQTGDGFAIDSDLPLASPDALPSDTVLLLATNGVKEIWEEVRQTVDDIDPYDEFGFQYFLDEIEYETGIDVEGDVVDSLNGEMALALLPGDVRAGIYDVLLLAGLRDAGGIRRALDRLADSLERESGIELDRSSHGDYEVVTATPQEFGLLGGDYDPGYLVGEDWVALGSTYRSLAALHDAATGDSEPLSSTDDFSGLMSMAPDPADWLLYADLAAGLEMLEDALDGDMRSDFERDFKPFVEPLEAFLLAGSVTKEAIRFTAVLTLGE